MIHAQTLKRSTLAVLFSQMLLLGFVVSALSPLANAEASSEQQLYDRILDSIKRLEQQRLEEAVLPGKDKAQDKQKELRQDPDTETLPEVVTRCFPIEHIQIESAGEPAPHLQRWAVKQVQAWQGRCLLLTDIQALQRELNNKLITRGYITSRVLLPEQKIADGELKLLIAAGRVETVIGDGVKARLVELALPSRRGQLLNLRDLEQGVENLSRLPGMSFAFDLQPGAAYGTSKLLAKASWPRQYRASWLASESYYGSTAHGNTQLSFEWGSLFGQPDRLTVGINSDLDREVSDQARGGFFNYDLTLGYWLMAASFNRQRYENQIAGVQKIAANGATDLSQLELKRILYRSPYTRLGLAALGSYADVRNLLDETTIRVSSYRLQSNGLRLDGSQLLGRTQLAASLTYENTKADGPATQVLPGLSVADVNHERWQLYASTQRQFTPLRSALQFKINAQYSDDALFASERFSLASQSSVRAYDDISVSGNNGVAGSLDASITPRIDKLPLKG
ncbi:MAG TPA: ShlB/FhaC/HecB family hemolysin secretion/activation protein, partial [Pseudomonadales bacterium]